MILNRLMYLPQGVGYRALASDEVGSTTATRQSRSSVGARETVLRRREITQRFAPALEPAALATK